MLINGSAVNTVAINSYSQLIEYLVGIASYVYSTTADTTLTATVASDAAYSVSTDGQVTAALYTGVAVPSSYKVTTSGSNRLESRLSGDSNFSYVVTGAVTPSVSVAGDSSYKISTAGTIKAIIVTGPSSVSYVISTQGKQTVIASVEGVSSYSIGTVGKVTAKVYVDGESSYKVSTTGDYQLTAMLQGLVEYTVNTTGNNRTDAWVGGNSSYQVSELSRANVVKYSQEVLEEFACVTYNVEMVDNEFIVSPIENSVTADPTIVFEVNKC